ncbi:hypothetical protein EMGBD4_08450 [Verrucomicrobiota bacterium]|nr:hypothetical protein EMGBD4_08450 [Verrucomicrobiota bacterium]
MKMKLRTPLLTSLFLGLSTLAASAQDAPGVKEIDPAHPIP